MIEGPPTPMVSAVIVHLGRRELLEDCLASLHRSKGIERVETIVVDNASGETDLEKMVAGYPGTRIVRLEERCGYPAASNAGIRASRGRYVLWCNNDLVFEPEAVERLAAFLECHPQYGAAGPRLLNPDGSFQPSFSLLHMDLRSLLVERLGLGRLLPGWDLARNWRGHELESRDVAVGTGACCLIRRDALGAIGGIDERFYMYTEEFDLCFRLWAGGWRVRYLPDARVVHLGGQTTRKSPTRFVLQAWRSRYAYVRKHQGASAEAVLAAAVVGSTTARYLATLLAGAGARAMGDRERAEAYLHRRRLHASLVRLSLTSGRHAADQLERPAGGT
jgi:N-acetylglucosaminyl-diphospho-decaprenol L-rhamnosyltransferase